MDALASSAEGFTHVRVIVGMVLGLSLARLVNGLTRFVQHPGSVPVCEALVVDHDVQLLREAWQHAGDGVPLPAVAVRVTSVPGA